MPVATDEGGTEGGDVVAEVEGGSDEGGVDDEVVVEGGSDDDVVVVVLGCDEWDRGWVEWALGVVVPHADNTAARGNPAAMAKRRHPLSRLVIKIAPGWRPCKQRRARRSDNDNGVTQNLATR